MKLQDVFLLNGKLFMHGIKMDMNVFGITFSYKEFNLACFDGYNLQLNEEIRKQKTNTVELLKLNTLICILREYGVEEYVG